MSFKDVEGITSESVKGLVVRVCGLGLMYLSTVLAANYLGAEQFGIFSSVLSLSPIWAIVAVGGVGLFATKSIATIPREDRGETAREVAIAYAAGSVGLILVLILVALLWLLFTELGTEQKGKVLVYSMAIFPVMLIMSLRQNIALPIMGAASAMFPEQIVLPVVFGALIIVVEKLFSHCDTPLVIASYFIAALMAWSFGLALLWKKGEFTKALWQKIKFRDIRRRFNLGRPFYFANVSTIVMSNAVTVLISFLLGFKEAGMYFAASRLSGLCYIPLGVIDQVVMPPAARFHNIGDHSSLLALAKLSTSLGFLAGIFIALCIAILREPLLGLFGKEFEAASNVLLILLVGQTVNTLFGPNAALMRMTGLEQLYSRICCWAAFIFPLCVYVSARWDGVELVAICVSSMLIGLNVLQCLCLWHKRRLVVLPYGPAGLLVKLRETAFAKQSWKLRLPWLKTIVNGSQDEIDS